VPSSVEELQAALRALRPGEVNAIAYVADAMVTSHAELVIEAAQANRLPTIFQDRESVEKGALASYGESYYTIGRLSAKHVQRVLLGANHGDLPVEQRDRLHFVISLKSARALGLTIPGSVLARADEIIE
jgi:putative ABC transport system substrate-binding protein